MSVGKSGQPSTPEVRVAVEEIAFEAGKAMCEPPSEFQFRMPLRLWLRVNPALVSRYRAHHKLVDINIFERETAFLWNLTN
jgi:hypothetical protein